MGRGVGHIFGILTSGRLEIGTTIMVISSIAKLKSRQEKYEFSQLEKSDGFYLIHLLARIKGIVGAN